MHKKCVYCSGLVSLASDQSCGVQLVEELSFRDVTAFGFRLGLVFHEPDSFDQMFNMMLVLRAHVESAALVPIVSLFGPGLFRRSRPFDAMLGSIDAVPLSQLGEVEVSPSLRIGSYVVFAQIDTRRPISPDALRARSRMHLPVAHILKRFEPARCV